MAEAIVLVGYGGHAQSVADSIEREGKYRIIGYTDRNPQTAPYPYLGTDDVLPDLYREGVRLAAVCVGYLGKGDIRERIYDRLRAIGYRLPTVIDPSAIVSGSAQIGEGSFVGKCAVVNADAWLGKMVIINTHAVIEHSCVVGDFSHVAVAAVLCGGVTVGSRSLIGANATVLQMLCVGSESIVAAGTVVTRDVGDRTLIKRTQALQVEHL